MTASASQKRRELDLPARHSLLGPLPAAAALAVRLFVQKPERWKNLAHRTEARLSELFSPARHSLLEKAL